ncbi:MAG: NAD-dependent epimerase/dehydratase family protein [Butyrivibrio sp.]|nr:NAD-dependent epimerase/dehydratase family protein [Butyrivibrio sp.]
MILVTGARGFVGKKIMDLCRDTVAAPSLRNVTEDDVRRILDESGVDTIIHTAAVSDIQDCEADPVGSYRANVQLPVLLAKAAEGRKLICFSSDQVYTDQEKEGPYTEEDAKPANTYAKHKLEMEERVLDICPDAVMLRAEWMYDYGPGKPNYYTTVRNATEPLRFSSGNYRGVTYVKEVAENMEKVIALPGGAYNFGSETNKSMYDVTREFAEALGMGIKVEDVPPLHNLWMDCSKARKYGVVFSEVLDGLLKCAKDEGGLL